MADNTSSTTTGNVSSTYSFFFSKDRGELSALLKKKKNRRPARGHGLQGLRAPAFYFLVFVFRLTPFYAF